MNNFYKKYSGKDDPDLLEEIMENSERYFIPELITLMNNLGCPNLLFYVCTIDRYVNINPVF